LNFKKNYIFDSRFEVEEHHGEELYMYNGQYYLNSHNPNHHVHHASMPAAQSPHINNQFHHQVNHPHSGPYYPIPNHPHMVLNIE
jgi:hypothetical protein